MDPFTCYYCDEKSSTQKGILEHTIVCHRTRELKCKSLELSPTTGRFGHRTLNFKLFPSEIEQMGNLICIDINGNVITKASASPAHKRIKQDENSSS